MKHTQNRQNTNNKHDPSLDNPLEGESGIDFAAQEKKELQHQIDTHHQWLEGENEQVDGIRSAYQTLATIATQEELSALKKDHNTTGEHKEEPQENRSTETINNDTDQNKRDKTRHNRIDPQTINNKHNINPQITRQDPQKWITKSIKLVDAQIDELPPLIQRLFGFTKAA